MTDREEINVGDLVMFHTNSWVMNRKDYANPGLVLEDVSGPSRFSTGHRFRVLWADTKQTTEHFSYLKLVGSSND
tara:strand:+ start:201 stop:425 length:225 start_codon:yes stop_codon:yes gene_type:complete